MFPLPISRFASSGLMLTSPYLSCFPQKRRPDDLVTVAEGAYFPYIGNSFSIYERITLNEQAVGAFRFLTSSSPVCAMTGPLLLTILSSIVILTLMKIYFSSNKK
jgi:hypothetical protein